LQLKKEDGYLEHFWPLMPYEFLIKDKLNGTFRYLETKFHLKADDDDDIPVVATSLVPIAYDGLIGAILG
jgi:hypothetical protein